MFGFGGQQHLDLRVLVGQELDAAMKSLLETLDHNPNLCCAHSPDGIVSRADQYLYVST